jgi:hypothetical protein
MVRARSASSTWPTASPTFSEPEDSTPWWPNTSAWIFSVSPTLNCAPAADHALVAHLAARFGVERRGVQHHNARLTGGQLLHRRACRVQRDDLAVGSAARSRRICFLAAVFNVGAILNLPAARAVLLLSIAASKPSSSSVMLRSRQISAVRSSGKP